MRETQTLITPYRWLCLGLVLFFIPVVITLPALNDLFVHAATIERLKADFWNPRDPMVNEPGLGNPYFSPYMVFWAAVSKTTGLDTFAVLRLGAVVNLFLFLSGFGSFVSTLSRKRLAPVFALAAVFFLWGTGFVYWSGFISFPSLIASIAYPSTFAVGLGLWLWVWLFKLVGRQQGRAVRVGLAVGIAAGGSVVLLSHQFTALGVCLYAGLYVLRHRKEITREVWVCFAIITVLVLLAIAAWPWFDLLAATGGVEGFNAVHKALYSDLVKRYSLLLVAFPVLWNRMSKDKGDPLTITVLICLAVFIYGGISQNYFLGRIFPPVALLSQVAVGIAMAEWVRPGHRTWQRIYVAAASLAIVAGTLSQSGFVNLMVPGAYPPAMDRMFGSRMTKGDYVWLTEHVSSDESVMTTNWDARAMAPGYGIFTVMTAWPDPFLGETERVRKADSQEFFKGATSAERRRQLMERYDARWVVVVEDSSTALRQDPHFTWIAERPDSGMREEDTRRGKQQLFEYVGP